MEGTSFLYHTHGVMTLMHALCLFALLSQGFRNFGLRAWMPQLLGTPRLTTPLGR
jgi:nitrate reductase NapE component